MKFRQKYFYNFLLFFATITVCFSIYAQEYQTIASTTQSSTILGKRAREKEQIPSSVKSTSKRPRLEQQLRLILTPYAEEAEIHDYDTTMFSTAIAIYQQSAPIITQKSIIHKILKLQKRYLACKPKLPVLLENLTIPLLATLQKKENAFTEFFVYKLTSSLVEKPDSWLVWSHDQSDSYLCIPVSYIKRHANSSDDLQLNEKLGLKILHNPDLIPQNMVFLRNTIDMNDVIDDYTELAWNVIKNLQKKIDNDEIQTENLSTFHARASLMEVVKTFTKKDFKSSEIAEILKKCNIFKSEKHGSIEITSFDCEYFKDLKNKIENLTPSAILPLFLEMSGQWNILLIGHGVLNVKIAEFSLDGFKDFVLSLNTKLNTSTLTYKSCNSGGNNQLEVFTETNDKITPNFTALDLSYTVACCNIGNLPVLATLTEFTQNLLTKGLKALACGEYPTDYLCNQIIDTKSFFEKVETYDSTKDTRPNLIAALKKITPKIEGNIQVYKRMTHIPQIRWPHAKNFEIAEQISNAVKIIDNFEANQPELALNDKNVVILIPQIIKSKILFNIPQPISPFFPQPRSIIPEKLPAFISRMPQESCHIFKEMQTNQSMINIIKECFLYHPRKKNHFYDEICYTQAFLIKKLKCDQFSEIKATNKTLTLSTQDKQSIRFLNGEVFNNIFIVLAPDDSYIIFEHNNQIFSGTLDIDENEITWEYFSLDLIKNDVTAITNALKNTISTLLYDLNESVASLENFAENYDLPEKPTIDENFKKELFGAYAEIFKKIANNPIEFVCVLPSLDNQSTNVINSISGSTIKMEKGKRKSPIEYRINRTNTTNKGS